MLIGRGPQEAPVSPSCCNLKRSDIRGTNDSKGIGQRVMTTPLLRTGIYNTTQNKTPVTQGSY